MEDREKFETGPAELPHASTSAPPQFTTSSPHSLQFSGDNSLPGPGPLSKSFRQLRGM